jgi:hypothetical protein
LKFIFELLTRKLFTHQIGSKEIFEEKRCILFHDLLYSSNYKSLFSAELAVSHVAADAMYLNILK